MQDEKFVPNYTKILIYLRRILIFKYALPCMWSKARGCSRRSRASGQKLHEKVPLSKT